MNLPALDVVLKRFDSPDEQVRDRSARWHHPRSGDLRAGLAVV
jgi:hypothetical protein